MKDRPAALFALLPLTMALTTFIFFGLAVAATQLQDEFGVSRVELGVLGAANTGIGALLAPAAGRLTERIGGKVATFITLAFVSIAATSAALSTSFTMLLVSSGLGGVSQGLANPATNKMLAEKASRNYWGILAGVKQSGAQAAVVLSGVLVPLLSSRYGWRSTMWVVAALCLVAMPLLAALPSDPESTDRADPRAVKRLPPFVSRVAVYALLLGIVAGGLARFLTLFGEEAVGLSPARAGLVFAVFGVVSIPSRTLSGVLLDSGFSVNSMLRSMALLGASALVVVAVAPAVEFEIIWVGAVLAGLSIGTWNTVANFAVMEDGEIAGRATGRLTFGFLLGLATGGPVFGALIDSSGYEAAWLVGSLLCILGFLVIGARNDRCDK